MENERAVQALTEALAQVKVAMTNIAAFIQDEFTPVVEKFRKVWDAVVEEVEEEQADEETDDLMSKVELFLKMRNEGVGQRNWWAAHNPMNSGNPYDAWTGRDTK